MEIAYSIEFILTYDERESVYESKEVDAAVMAYWAWKESNLTLKISNPTGRSWGAWQQDASVAKDKPAFIQAYAWYNHLRLGKDICKNPAAIMWGSCNFKLIVAPWGTAETAADIRVHEAKRLLKKVTEQ